MYQYVVSIATRSRPDRYITAVVIVYLDFTSTHETYQNLEELPVHIIRTELDTAVYTMSIDSDRMPVNTLSVIIADQYHASIKRGGISNKNGKM